MEHTHSRLLARQLSMIEMVQLNPTFRYSTKRFRKATKCSAFRMFPGIASLSRSSGSTYRTDGALVDGERATRKRPTRTRHECILIGLLVGSVLETFHKLRILLLQFRCIGLFDSRVSLSRLRYGMERGANSSIFSPSLVTLRAAESSMGLVRSMLRDSMQTLSIRWQFSKSRWIG